MTSIKEIHKNLDSKMEGLEILKYSKEDTLPFVFRVIESYRLMLEIVEDNKSNVEKRLQSHDLQVVQSIITLYIWDSNGKEDFTKLTSEKRLELVTEAISLATEFKHWEFYKKHYDNGLVNAKINSTKQGDIVTFEYKSDEIRYFETMNEFILEDVNNSNERLLPRPVPVPLEQDVSSFLNSMKDFYKHQIDLWFNLPDDYRIGPYTLDKIKEFWLFVMYQSYCTGFKNYLKYYKKYIINNETEYVSPKLALLNVNQFKFVKCSNKEVRDLLYDFTYQGFRVKKRNKSFYTTLITEPIVKIKGKYYSSPKFTLSSNYVRNIFSTLNRLYNVSEVDDSDRREGIFINELTKRLSPYLNLKINSSIPINYPNKTDIDFVIYDENTGALVALELKWLNEPFTPIEIKDKDKEFNKALTKQLNNYLLGIKHNEKKFMKDNFNIDSNFTSLNLFVVSRGTVGSGAVDRSSGYEVINYRMLLKAIQDAGGNLELAAEQLQNRAYYPTEGKHYINTENVEGSIDNIKYIRQGFRTTHDYYLEI